MKNPPAMQETWVQSLGQEDPLEKPMATHSSILAWVIPWTEEPGGLQSMESQSWTTAEHLTFCENLTREKLIYNSIHESSLTSILPFMLKLSFPKIKFLC